MKNKLGSFLKGGYRLFHRGVIESSILPFFFSKERLRSCKLAKFENDQSVPSRPCIRIWFHAASVGELESLWPLVVASYDAQHEIILTVLSESAKTSLERLSQLLSEKPGGKIIFSGYSPWEGRWLESLQVLKPSLFITAKYEAWPELWASLYEEKISLAIVAARARKSLRIARKLSSLFSGGIPHLLLFPCLEEDASELKALFPESEIQVVGEPRWERVYERIKTGNARAKRLIEAFKNQKRPWGVIGSAWLEDLEFLGSAIQDTGVKEIGGTLWIVPHRIDSKSIQTVQAHLISKNVEFVLSTEVSESGQLPTPQKSNFFVILVNEMGFLSELYSVADWAYVGGGFGAGVHSTIEPAIHGIPIGVGPTGTEKFSEIRELSRSGQLKILRSAQDLDHWISYIANYSVRPEKASQIKSQWIQEAQLRLGATQKILTAIEKFI